MAEETIFDAKFPRGEHRDILIGPHGNVIWARPWQHNLIVDELRKLLAALMKGDMQASPLSFWAIGTGLETWDDGPLPSDDERITKTKLYSETSRKPIENITFLNGDFTNQLGINIQFTLDDISGDVENARLREFGLFAGGKADERDSGILVNHRIHPRIDLQEGLTLDRTLRLTF